MLNDCYAREGITSQADPPLKKEHSNNPLLNKYYYIYRPGQAKTKESEKQESALKAETGDVHVSKMSLALGNSADPSVKVEPHAECLVSWKVLNDAKSKVSKEYEAVMGLHKDLEAMHQNPRKYIKIILQELQEGMERVSTCLDELRVDLASTKLEICATMEKDKAKSTRDKLNDWKVKCSVHMDGLKALKRRIQALLDQ